jgi:hypothetical protein
MSHGHFLLFSHLPLALELCALKILKMLAPRCEESRADYLPRTPLRNIANIDDSSARLHANGGPAMNKNILALRGICGAGQQVQGHVVCLATSPMQLSRGASVFMRSPMAGRTPDDVKRAAKRMPSLNMSPARPTSAPSFAPSMRAATISPFKTVHASQPQMQQHLISLCQLNQRCPVPLFSSPSRKIDAPVNMFMCDMSPARIRTCVEPASAPVPAPIFVPLDPVNEAARVKREEAKAKREQKAALKAQFEAARLLQAANEAEQRAKMLAQQNNAVLQAIADIEEEEDNDIDLVEPLRNVSWELISVGQSLQMLAGKVKMYPVELQQIEDALYARKSTLETENVLAALHSTLLTTARGDKKTAAKSSSSSRFYISQS